MGKFAAAYCLKFFALLILGTHSFAMDQPTKLRKEYARFPTVEEIKKCLNDHSQTKDKFHSKAYWIERGKHKFAVRTLLDLDKPIATINMMSEPEEIGGYIHTYHRQKLHVLEQVLLQANYVVQFTDNSSLECEILVETCFETGLDPAEQVPRSTCIKSDWDNVGAKCFKIFNNSIFSTKQIMRPDGILDYHGARNKAAKAVWLIRESASNPGAITLSWYDITSNPQGFCNQLYILTDEKIWTPADRYCRDKRIDVQADCTDFGLIEDLYKTIAQKGFILEGQVIPPIDRTLPGCACCVPAIPAKPSAQKPQAINYQGTQFLQFLPK